MQEMLRPTPKREKPQAIEMPQASEEAQETPAVEAAPALAPAPDLERDDELSGVYQDLNDTRREMDIIEDALRDGDDLTDEERAGFEKSLESLGKRMEGLERERAELSKGLPPEEVQALHETWSKIEAVYEAQDEVPSIRIDPLQEASGLKGFWLKIRPENWTKKGRDRREYRETRIQEYRDSLTKYASELPRYEDIDVTKLSFNELEALKRQHGHALIVIKEAVSYDGLEYLRQTAPVARKKLIHAYERLYDKTKAEWEKQAKLQPKPAPLPPSPAEEPKKGGSTSSNLVSGRLGRSGFRSRR